MSTPAQIPAPPAGYTLDSATPPPPPGYTLDSAQPQPPAPAAPAPQAAPQPQPQGTGTAQFLNNRADQLNQESQRQMYMANGPEAQGRSFVNRAGHATLALAPAAASIIDRAAAGLTDWKNAAMVIAGMVDPAVPAAYFATQGTASLAGVGQPSSVKQAVQNPTPDNVQRPLLDAATVAGSAAGGAESPKSGAPVTAAGNALDTTRSARAAMPNETAALPDAAVRGSEKVFQAAAPTGTNTRFRANVYAAAGDLAEVGRDVNARLAQAKGGIIQPDMRARVTVDAINDHLQQMYETERAPQIANHPNAPVELHISDDTMAGLGQMARSGEAGLSKLALKARTGSLTLSEADQLARGVNAELRKYEAMTPEAQAAARVNTKALNGLKVLDRGLSEAIDDQLKIDGQPGLREYERRYAALSRLRDQLQVRMNTAELQHPGPVKAAVRAVHNVYSGMSGNIAGASQAAVADVRMGRALQSGLQDLADSGIKANRALPRGAAPLELTPPPGRVPPAGQENLPFNEGFSRDMQTGPNGPLNLRGEGRVPAATQDQLNFNGADQEPGPKAERRGGSGNSGPRTQLFSDEERAKRQAMLDEVEKARHPNHALKENPFDHDPLARELIKRDPNGPRHPSMDPDLERVFRESKGFKNREADAEKLKRDHPNFFRGAQDILGGD